MKKKWNYAVMKSIFGDLWVGKTKLLVDEKRIYTNIDDAIYKAKMLFEDYHMDFDPDEDNNDLDLQDQYDEIENTTEEDVEEIKKGMEKFIVN